MNKPYDPTDKSPLFPLVMGRDYYLEQGKYVFTSHFLRKRGHCCGSNCRHCPYKTKL